MSAVFVGYTEPLSPPGRQLNFNIDLFSVWDSVHYPTQILLTVPPESVRAYVNVITKFSGIDRFPFSAAMELRCLEARGKFGKHSRGLRVAL